MADPIPDKVDAKTGINKEQGFNAALSDIVAPTHSEKSELNNNSETQVLNNPIATPDQPVQETVPEQQEGLPTEATVTENTITEQLSQKNTEGNQTQESPAEKNIPVEQQAKDASSKGASTPEAQEAQEAQEIANQQQQSGQDLDSERQKRIEELLKQINGMGEESNDYSNLESIY